MVLKTPQRHSAKQNVRIIIGNIQSSISWRRKYRLCRVASNTVWSYIACEFPQRCGRLDCELICVTQTVNQPMQVYFTLRALWDPHWVLAEPRHAATQCFSCVVGPHFGTRIGLHLPSVIKRRVQRTNDSQSQKLEGIKCTWSTGSRQPHFPTRAWGTRSLTGPGAQILGSLRCLPEVIA